jgi:hypothetical protein
MEQGWRRARLAAPITPPGTLYASTSATLRILHTPAAALQVELLPQAPSATFQKLPSRGLLTRTFSEG